MLEMTSQTMANISRWIIKGINFNIQIIKNLIEVIISYKSNDIPDLSLRQTRFNRIK